MEPSEFRETGHRVVDLLADYLESVEDKRVFPDVEPSVVEAIFDEPLPREPLEAGALIDELEQKLLPYCTHVGHPGYLGLITPSPAPIGVVGDMIASALNQNLGAYSIGPSAVAMERRTVRWLTDLAGYDEHAGGNLTSGGTMANFIALKLARDFASGQRAQHDGLKERWAVYTSEERHVSVDKAVDAVGVGRGALRALPTNDDFSLDIDALERAIACDKSEGVRSMCIVAMAGSTNTGAIDDLAALRTIADREGMWLHADAAYGGGMLLSHDQPNLLRDLPVADSITMDPHKWFYAPLDVGALLVRDDAHLTRSFGLKPAYLTDELDDAGERYQYYVHGFEQSRRFRALKVWMSFKRYGADEIGRWVDANVRHARRLHELAADSKFVSAAAPQMSAVCIRYDAPGHDEATVGRLHHEVASEIEASGRFWISTTFLKNRWWFRVNPVNFRTRSEHMDELFERLSDACANAAIRLAAAGEKAPADPTPD